MNGINSTTVIEKHQHAKRLYSLVGGGDVVGQEVDADNRLVYVIREGQTLRLAYAEDENIVPEIIIQPGDKSVITLDFSKMLQQTQQPERKNP